MFDNEISDSSRAILFVNILSNSTTISMFNDDQIFAMKRYVEEYVERVALRAVEDRYLHIAETARTEEVAQLKRVFTNRGNNN